MAFEIIYSLKAEQDLDGILHWLLNQGAGDTGRRWFEKLQNTVATLSELPHRCPLAPEDTSVQFEMRQLLYGRKPHVYRVLFTIEDGTVFVLRVRGPYQNPISLH